MLYTVTQSQPARQPARPAQPRICPTVTENGPFTKTKENAMRRLFETHGSHRLLPASCLLPDNFPLTLWENIGTQKADMALGLKKSWLMWSVSRSVNAVLSLLTAYQMNIDFLNLEARSPSAKSMRSRSSGLLRFVGKVVGGLLL
jgi:hypothetical protein